MCYDREVKRWYDGYVLSGLQIYNPRAVVGVMRKGEFKSYWSETASNENSLSSVLAIAYLCAMQYYFKPIRELPTGRGFAYFVFIPKPEYQNEYPALIVELKWNRNAQTAMQQIKDRNYPASILSYTGDILLVAINYDKSSKEHQCQIEQYQKE